MGKVNVYGNDNNACRCIFFVVDEICCYTTAIMCVNKMASFEIVPKKEYEYTQEPTRAIMTSKKLLKEMESMGT
jgi:hypothetical protein